MKLSSNKKRIELSILVLAANVNVIQARNEMKKKSIKQLKVDIIEAINNHYTDVTKK